MSRPVPTVRLAILAAVGALAIAILPAVGALQLFGRVPIDGRFLVVNLAILLIAVADLTLAANPDLAKVRRIHPSSITLGHKAQLSWEVTRRARPRSRLSNGTKPFKVWIADELAPSLHPGTRRLRLSVPARGQTVGRIEIEPKRRGLFQPRKLVVKTIGPLGLMHRQKTRELETKFKVIPPFRSAKEAELSLHKAKILEIGLRSARGRGGGTDFESLRELGPDDESRRIDWAATARSQKPILRTYRAEQNQTILCLLDSGRTMAGRVESIPRMEFAMDGAMLLAELATGLGDKMGLLAFDTDVHTDSPWVLWRVLRPGLG